jgi:dTDP-4-amino-4,6-dideoxygalactose transaminase
MNYGSEIKYHNDYGINSRLDELQASFLNLKLTQLDTDNDLRKLCRRYLAEISNDKIVLPHWELSNNHVFICLLLEQQN